MACAQDVSCSAATITCRSSTSPTESKSTCSRAAATSDLGRFGASNMCSSLADQSGTTDVVHIGR